jgi:hypothetical protein
LNDKFQAYIVGIEENSPEAKIAEERFQKSIQSLANTEQDILEARATVKTHALERDRKRYEVSVLIRTSKDRHDFVETGWSLQEVFENINTKIKRLKTKPRERKDHRRRLARGQMESIRYAG